jgi:hypothetical protein
MKANEFIVERKKNTNAAKPRNPVAKNANSAIGGGAAGAHKDKKVAAKQGDTKHKNKTYTEQAMSENDVDDFLKAGGQIQQIKPNKGPRHAGISLGSKHIGAASGGGKSNQISGRRANVRKVAKPVIGENHADDAVSTTANRSPSR